MNIVAVLKQEERHLQQRLAALRHAIAALDGKSKVLGLATIKHRRRSLSAAARAKISRAAKARWARVKAEKDRKANKH